MSPSFLTACDPTRPPIFDLGGPHQPVAVRRRNKPIRQVLKQHETPMRNIAQLLREPDVTVAIVGATDNPAKYGSVIYRDLKRKGFKLYPVNPNRESVDGDVAYPNLAALPSSPTIVNYVVPPTQTIAVLEEAKRLGLANAWVQPGAESPEVLRYLQEQGFNYLANACIMVQSRLRAR